MKSFIILISLVSLILSTAVVKTSSKKTEEKIFILNENLSILKKKYNFVILENTYLSNPSRLIEIMKVDKNEDYIHLDISNLKTICANCQRILQKLGVKWKQGDLVPDF